MPKEIENFLLYMQNESNSNDNSTDQTIVEGLDFYFDEGLMVLTRHYLLNRGFCCNNDCRHCPYGVNKDNS